MNYVCCKIRCRKWHKFSCIEVNHTFFRLHWAIKHESISAWNYRWIIIMKILKLCFFQFEFKKHWMALNERIIAIVLHIAWLNCVRECDVNCVILNCIQLENHYKHSRNHLKTTKQFSSIVIIWISLEIVFIDSNHSEHSSFNWIR